MPVPPSKDDFSKKGRWRYYNYYQYFDVLLVKANILLFFFQVWIFFLKFLLPHFYYISTLITLSLASNMDHEYYKYNANGRIIIPDNDAIDNLPQDGKHRDTDSGIKQS